MKCYKLSFMLLSSFLLLLGLLSLGGKVGASAAVYPYTVSTYGTASSAPVCSITSLNPYPLRFSSSTPQWITMTIKNTTSSSAEDGIFIGDAATSTGSWTVNGAYFIDGTSAAHGSLSFGYQSGSTYALYAGDYGNGTNWSAGTSARWGIEITPSSVSDANGKAMLISVHRQGVTGGTICTMDIPGATQQDAIASFASVAWSNSCPSGSEGSYPFCSAPTSTIGGGGGGTSLTEADVFTALQSYFTPRVKEVAAIGIAAFVSYIVIVQFRWRSKR